MCSSDLDLTSAGSRGDIAIELPDQGVGDGLMVFVVPCVEPAENQNDQSIDHIGKSHASCDDKHVHPAVSRGEGYAKASDDLIEGIPPKGSHKRKPSRDQNDGEVNDVAQYALLLFLFGFFVLIGLLHKR